MGFDWPENNLHQVRLEDFHAFCLSSLPMSKSYDRKKFHITSF